MAEKQNSSALNFSSGAFIGACLLLVHTVSFMLFEFYTIPLYLITAPACAGIIFLGLIEKCCPILMILGYNIISGTIGPLIFALVPEFASFGYAIHYLAFGFAVFFESNQYSLHFLFGSNVISWGVSFYYYFPGLMDGTPMPQQMQCFFGNYSSLGQMIFGILISYMMTAMLNREKRRTAMLRDKYKNELLALNEKFKKSNVTLEHTNKTLQETLAERESFILRFSHEIRNPLNSLLGNVELCLESSNLHHDEDRRMLQDAKISGEILLQLLNNILDSAKISAKRLEVNIKLHEVREFYENLWAIGSDIISKAKLFGLLAINFNVPGLVEFDQLRMKQILMNLFTNSVKFTQKGFINTFIDFVETSEGRPTTRDMKPRYFGIALQESDGALFTSTSDDYSFQEYPLQKHEVLTLNTKKFQLQQTCFNPEEEQKVNLKIESHESRPSKLFRNRATNLCSNQSLSCDTVNNKFWDNNPSPSLPEREGFLRIEIVDSGCGMSKEELKNVFNSLDKNKSASSARQIGTGLGLWITKELVELMGGKIEIYSTPNVGTCLVIALKTRSGRVSAGRNQNSEPIKFKPRVVPVPKRVLIVEDIAYNQEVNSRMIQKCGITEISMASNGFEALELFKAKGEQYFDTIFTDIDMPIMDGKTSTKLIREHERKHKWKPVKIIVLTGYAESETQQAMLNPIGPYRANVFLSKPSSLESIMKALKSP